MAQVSYGTITISDLTDGASIWTTTVAPTTPNYTFTISNLQGSESTPKIGDIILYDTYRYTITTVNNLTVLANYRQSLQGTEGRGVESIETKFINWSTNTESNAPTTSNTWYEEPPVFNSQYPYYYVWVRTIYTDHINPTDEIYLDNSVSYALNKTTEIDALNAQAKYFWWDRDGAHIASGLTSADSNDNIQQSQPASYGFNALTAPGFLKLRYEDVDYVQLTTNSLTFYNGIHILNITSNPTSSTGTIGGFAYTYRMSISTIKTQSGSNTVLVGDALRRLYLSNNKYEVDYFYVGYTSSSYAYLTKVSNIQGKKAVELNTESLTFYKPLAYNSSSEPTAAAILNSNGLVLSEGGIKSGDVNAGNSGFIYLSTKNYSSNLTINNHTASNWREIIGTKFGVDADGNLYASNVNISGDLRATSLSAGTKTSSTSGTGTYIDNNGNIYSGSGSTNNFQVTYAGTLTASGAILKSVILQDSSNNTKAVIDGNGLTIYDGSGTAAANKTAIFGSTTTIGYTSGNKYNVYIDGSGINLRYNTTLLNIIDKDGMKIYVQDVSGYTDKPVAEFGTITYIGRHENEASSYIAMGAGSLRFYDKQNNLFFHISDLRDSIDNVATIHLTFVGDGQNKIFEFLLPATNTQTITVTCDDDNAGTPTKTVNSITFPTAPAINAQITVSYLTNDKRAKRYTLGIRHTDDSPGPMSVAEGLEIKSSGIASHAEGRSTEATGEASHAEGRSTKANGANSHAEGYEALATGNTSHAEGVNTWAQGSVSHAEGYNCIASGVNSHAQNLGTTASSANQTVIGKYNVTDSNDKYSLIIGNGTRNGDWSNALAVDWSGNVIAQGMVGQIVMYAGSIAPNGWLWCDGREVSRTTYSKLFNVIGTTYGSGDGSTTFNLPNFCGRTPVGAGESNATGATVHTRGQMGGSEDAIIPYHKHDVAQVNITSSGGHTHTITTKYRANYLQSGTNRDSVNGGGTSTSTAIDTIAANTGTHIHSVPAHDTDYVGTSGNVTGANMMPYLGINFIIHVGIDTV